MKSREAASSSPVRSRWIFPTLADYRREWIRRDIVAGLSAGAIVIPQAMAYATIANLPVQVGLYTCIVPMFVYAVLGGSRAMSVSTTSTIATLTATTLFSVGVVSDAHPDDALGALITLTMLVGVILLIGRLLRLGSLVENISQATVLGLKIGVGATVAVGQLPKLLGQDANDSGGGFVASLVGALGSLDHTNLATVLLSVGSILALIVLQRFAPRFPSFLLVVTGGILLVWVAEIDQLGVSLIEPVPSGLPIPQLPDLSLVEALIPGALAIAVIAFLESAAVARALRSRTDQQINSDQELLAAGAANAIGSFFSAMPAAGGFSQSAVNDRAGARSQVAGLLTVFLALLVALFFGPVLSLLPEATLAAVVFVAVASLINIPELVRWFSLSRIDFWIALMVAVVGLVAGLLVAVAVGVFATLLLVLHELNIPRLSIQSRSGDAIVIRLGTGLYTGNALANERAVVALVAAQPEATRAVVLDVRQLNILTVTVLDMLEELEHELAGMGIVLHLARLPSGASKIAAKTHWFAGLASEGRVHTSTEEGLVAALANDLS
ncbi:SulP family inorganic anion transporter [Microbacterium sp. NPDC076768]|uniref:SulP family inorganic anion transporter n=1 Tax=Microbacterium sp. NPDC076768 TaxID=3154858 RepID=UPI003426B674